MKKFCIIGHNIGYALSPAMHQAAMHELEIDGSFEIIDIAPDKLPEFIEELKSNYDGAAITKPYKQEIIKYLDKKAEAVDKIGACNTVIIKDGVMTGTNTDAYGALVALRSGINPIGKRVLILGAGGAARSIAFMLSKAETKSISIWNRTAEKAKSIAQDFNTEIVSNLSEIDPEGFDIVINTTTVGTNENKSLIPESFWTDKHTAMDIVYSPLETAFLRDASNAGSITITGDIMLVHQAIAQFKLWHNKDIEPEVLAEAFFNA